MSGLKKLVGAYLVIVGVAVAVFFIINSLLTDSIDVLSVWYVLDVLMLIGLALALYFNYVRKREVEAHERNGSVTRPYVESNALFYLTAAVTIIFLHNYLSLLANGADSLDGNHQAWVIWAFVDTLLPIAFGLSGCRLWREASGS